MPDDRNRQDLIDAAMRRASREDKHGVIGAGVSDAVKPYTREELEALQRYWSDAKEIDGLTVPMTERLLATARAGLEDRERLREWMLDHGRHLASCQMVRTWGDPVPGTCTCGFEKLMDETVSTRSGREAKA